MKDEVHTAGSTAVGLVVGRRVGPDDGRRVGKPGVGPGDGRRVVGLGDGRFVGRRSVGGLVGGGGATTMGGDVIGLVVVGRRVSGGGSGINNGLDDVGLRVVGRREVGLRVGMIPGVSSMGEYVG